MRIVEGVFYETSYPTTPKVVVLSRQQLENYKFGNEEFERVAIISIVNPGNSFPKVKKTKDYHYARFEFYDIGEPITDLFGETWYPMTEEDAKKVAYFVNQLWHRIDLLIVQCEAGQSRSAGVAGAILKAKTGDDWDIFGNKKYTPNMVCYRKVLNAFKENENAKN